MPESELLFTADSLMALGCGRLFEGTPAQMWESLQKLRALPDDTIVCSGHEYTESNARFALSLDPENAALISRYEGIKAARIAGRPTVPSALDDEIRTNPFLRADDPAFKAAIGMTGASDVDVFAEIRARKDKF
jgi:hydroxyacylglutathione hydrolase